MKLPTFHKSLMTVEDTTEPPSHDRAAKAKRPSPLFICGAARSGTTLLAGLLDSHPKLAVFPGETYFYRTVFDRKLRGFTFLAMEATLSPGLMRLLARSTWRVLTSVSHSEIFDCLLRWSESFPPEASVSRERKIEKVIAGSNESQCFWQCYLDLYDLLSVEPIGERKFWVEKTPSTERFVHLIEAQFGNTVRYLHIIRDPRDVVASWFQRSRPVSADRMQCLLRVCHIWAFSVSLAVTNAQYCDARYRVLRYEDLVRDTDNVITLISNFLGITMDSTMRIPTRNSKPQPVNSAYAIDAGAGSISNTQIGRHPEVLSVQEVCAIEKLLGPQMDACGYSPGLQCGTGQLQMSAASRLLPYAAPLDVLRRLHVVAMQYGARQIPLVNVTKVPRPVASSER
jgi:hypothetical protein